MTPQEIEHLIARAAAGELSTDDALLLLDACRRAPGVLDALALHVSLDRLLHAVAADPDGRNAAQEFTLRIEQQRAEAMRDFTFPERAARRVRQSLWLRGLAAAAALLLIAGLAFFARLKPSAPAAERFSADGPPSAPAPKPDAVAVLKRAVGVEWMNPAESPAAGEALPAGWLRFRSGSLQIEFLGGAQLLVTGPAEVRLDGSGAAFVQSGKASAYVPEPARGFTLRAPGMDVVDLGTAFGLDVSKGGPPEVHVFAGEVALSSQGAAAAQRKLDAGKALRLDGEAFHEIPPRPADFPDGEKLARLDDAESRRRVETWKQAAQELDADPAALLHYTFEDEPQWSRAATNRVVRAGKGADGAIVGAGRTAGRWPGKHGLEFRSPGDRLRFDLPGRHEAVTLLAWVRVDSLPNPFNALLMPSRYQAGSLHWNLERGGELRLTLCRGAAQGYGLHNWDGPVSAPVMTDMNFGCWIFLATTYDSASGEVRHYRDGQPVARGEFPNRLPVALTDMEFGNWGARPDEPSAAWTRRERPDWRVRNFVGRLDELAVLARVMTAEEISRHYEVGKP